MLPAPSGYLAVRGRILSIPGTEYVVITPDWGTGGADVAQTQDTNSNSVVKIGNEDVKDQHHTAQATSNRNSVVKLGNEDVKDPQDTTKSTSSDGNVDDVALSGSPCPSANVQDSIDTLPLLPKRSRGRPPKGRSLSPCQCPNCKIKPNSDRHLCHFANCGKTFTKKQHLQAHIRKHLGTRPFSCPQQNCNATFTRYEELTRHYWLHSGEPRFQCQWCDKKFNRIDHYKGHARHCVNKTTGGLVEVLFRMEQEDEARVGQENQGAEEANSMGIKEEAAPLKTEEDLTDNSNKSDPIIIISDEETDADAI